MYFRYLIVLSSHSKGRNGKVTTNTFVRKCVEIK